VISRWKVVERRKVRAALQQQKLLVLLLVLLVLIHQRKEPDGGEGVLPPTAAKIGVLVAAPDTMSQAEIEEEIQNKRYNGSAVDNTNKVVIYKKL
jgi:hypothetical protein